MAVRSMCSHGCPQVALKASNPKPVGDLSTGAEFAGRLKLEPSAPTLDQKNESTAKSVNIAKTLRQLPDSATTWDERLQTHWHVHACKPTEP